MTTSDPLTNHLVEQYTALRFDIWGQIYPLLGRLVELGYTEPQAWEMIRGMEADLIKPMHMEYQIALLKARGLVPDE